MAAVKGSHRRHREEWEMTRWQTWCILSALGAKINTPGELVSFAWEKDEQGAPSSDIPTDDEIRQMQEMMRRENEERQGTS